MAAGNQMKMSLLERVGEGFSRFAEGFTKFVSRLFGYSTDWQVKEIGYSATRDPEKPYTIRPGSIVDRVNQFEPQMQALSDAELKGLSVKFREQLAAAKTPEQKDRVLEEILPEAFAACREAGRRSKNMRHYDVQMIGGVILHRRGISEMVTGEGKTLVATLPAYLNALTGGGVHVVTVNDYLARRDCEWMLPIYQALGLTAGYIQSDMDPVARRQAYECDITYGTNSEFGFDYLRDNMKPARFDDENYHPYYRQVQRPLNYAIIDEVDNILIDEARTPLIISGPAHSDLKRYEQANAIAAQLIELEKKDRGEENARRAAAGEPALEAPNPNRKPDEKPFLGFYYEVKEKERTCHLTDLGVRKAEELAGVESFYTAGNMEWPHLIDNSLKAHTLYQRDRHYLVMDHEGERKIVIIDEFTGRALFGRQWSDGLHQAVEAKHKRDGVAIKQETQTLATITLQNYFKLYRKLAGMTGTAMTEAGEFYKIYKLDVVAIPTNKPLRRVNHPDLVYLTDKDKWEAIITEVVEVHNAGRPILIGTTDVAKSEKLSGLLKRKGIRHELLNAKPENVARESEIVAQAGRKGAVTIATNMAGRGTDIILGGNPETLAWAMLKDKYPTRLDVPDDVWKATVDGIEAKEKMKEQGREVAALGGLHIVGTERHESRRIDNQLRGRAGRQGDPGSSRFYLSLQDELMRLFGGEWVAGILTRLGMKEGEAIESRMVSKRIQAAQKKVEEYHFDQRKNLLEYDEVMDTQRKRVYGKRNQILNDRNCKAELLEMIDAQTRGAVERFLGENYGAESFAEFAANRLGVEFEPGEFVNQPYEEAVNLAKDKAIKYIPTVIQEGMDENLGEDEDPKDWKWQEMARVMSGRYGLKLTDRQLKQIGRENLAQYLLDEASKSIQAVDLSEGRKYLARDWGLESLIDWARQKFQLTLTAEELGTLNDDQVHDLIVGKVREGYRQKEITFPVEVAMATHMAERTAASGGPQQKYDREGLFRWARHRFADQTGHLQEQDFRTESRSRLREILLEISRQAYPSTDQTAIDEKLEEALSGTSRAEPGDAKELCDWMKETYRLEVDPASLTGRSSDEVRQTLWNAFDRKYRPEMRSMERSLLLGHLDSSWKKHLLTMDHLRSGIGLWSYAQVDPKTKYKQEGMKEFDTMWENLQDRVTDSIFRMEDAGAEAFQEALWAGQMAQHEQAQSYVQSAASQQQQEAEGTTNQASDKKKEPIRNRMEKVGRNDPCPCGSGKKYKNCHMRINQQV
jgi:preprotein translocase subunit SecA